jgi:hypothetical protein
MALTTGEALAIASAHLRGLVGHEFDLLTLTKPVSPEAAVNLAKVVSKLSPLLGNLIEFNVCEYLSDKPEFKDIGKWQRQDPGFPDAVFIGEVQPTPGFEIKAWFPLATEITARFKDSQNHFSDDQTHVAMIAWLPEFLIFGKPRIIDVVTISGATVAKARDDHYHRPPDYLVIEPEDTSARTSNLQQTNTNGHKFQGTPAQLVEAKNIVESWGRDAKIYSPTVPYQALMRELINRFPYRLDTNYAKLDRIRHAELEAFKTKVNGLVVNGLTVATWRQTLASEDEGLIRQKFEEHLGIKEADAGMLRK